jgi:hypothetical protein
MKILVVWDLMLFSLIHVYQFFRGFYGLHLSEHTCPVFIVTAVRALIATGFLQFTRQFCLLKFVDHSGKDYKGELACPITVATVYTLCFLNLKNTQE